MGSCLPRLEPVYSAVIAFGLGSIGSFLSKWHGDSFVTAAEGLGTGAPELTGAVWLLVNLGFVCTVIDLFTLLMICASTFDCFEERLRIPQFVTTSRFLGCMQLNVWLCFAVQTLLSQLVLIALVVCSMLLYLCHADHSQRGQAQGLIDGLVETHRAYNPFGGGPVNSDLLYDTPLISTKAILDGLNVARFCDAASGQDTGHHAALVYVGSLLLAVAQALLAAALSSEVERVAVHESAENVAVAAKRYTLSTATHGARADPASTLLESVETATYPFLTGGDHMMHQGVGPTKSAMSDLTAYGGAKSAQGPREPPRQQLYSMISESHGAVEY